MLIIKANQGKLISDYYWNEKANWVTSTINCEMTLKLIQDLHDLVRISF